MNRAQGTSLVLMLVMPPCALIPGAVALFLLGKYLAAFIQIGQAATVPVYLLTFLPFGLFLVAMVIYFATALVLCGRGGDDHE